VNDKHNEKGDMGKKKKIHIRGEKALRKRNLPSFRKKSCKV